MLHSLRNAICNEKYFIKQIIEKQTYKCVHCAHIHTQKRLEEAYKLVKTKCQCEYWGNYSITFPRMKNNL